METIYYNGKILTMAEQNGAAAIAAAPDALVVKNGVITAIGSFEKLKKELGKGAKYEDLNDQCLMPAFIDPHGHAALCGQMSMFADLSQCTCFDDIVQTLKDYIAKKKLTPKHAVMGFGYDHNFLAEQAHPDKRVLDRVSKDIPIFVLHVSAHLACANSAALALSGIDENTPDPQGGMIGRLNGGSEPSGYLEEGAMHLAQGAIAKKLKIDVITMLKGVQKGYLENGITTIQDGATTGRDFALLKLLSSLGMLKLDVVAYPMMGEQGDKIMQKNQNRCRKYKRHLKIGGYKLVLDGSPQGRSAWMSKPYLGGDPDYCAYPWLEDDRVAAFATQAVSEGHQLLAHCNGDAAAEQYLNAYEQALANTQSKQDLRPVMIHCQTVRNDQLDRMASINMIASIFVGHVWYWGDVHVKNFGEERGHHISPAKDALERGIHVNFHQDPPVTKPNMLHSVWCAVNRISRGGNVIGEDQKITVYDALRAVTVEGAYQYFEEDSKGTLAVGKRADMVILSDSPLAVDPMEIRNISVLRTIKDGKVIFRK